jgi:hypothetical protein
MAQQHHDVVHPPAPHGYGGAGASADDEYVNPATGSGHEHTDTNVWMIVQFAIWLVASAILTHLLMWGMFEWFVKARNDAAPAVEFPLVKGQEPRLPAGPRLQRFPANEAYDFRQRESAELNSYGYIDRNAGTVHIPIDEAMRLVVERGLPSRAQPAAGPDGDTPATASSLMPADSSSGRTMERRR